MTVFFRSTPMTFGKVLLLCIAAILWGGCLKVDNSSSEDPISQEELDAAIVGVGGRRVSEDWPIGDPATNQATFLTARMLESEVLRATGLPWEENGENLWQSNAASLGQADYQTNWSPVDSVNPTKLGIIRNMGLSVAEKLLTEEHRGTIFTEVNPDDTIDTSSGSVRTTIDALHERTFLEPITDRRREASIELLVAVQEESGSTRAWQALVAAWLSSAPFTYR